MRLKLFFIAIVLFLSTDLFSQTGSVLLANAYKTKSTIKLRVFFEDWSLKTKTMNGEQLNKSNDTIQNIYNVFQAFYKPKELNKIGGSEWGDDIYKNVKYLVIQNDIPFEIGDSIIDIFEDTLYFSEIFTKKNTSFRQGVLTSFRPDLSIEGSKCLILTKEYDNIINYFLGSKHLSLGIGDIMSPARSIGESRKRQEFLENYIKIFYGHWGGYWQLYSYPKVEKIRFDNTFNNAIISYSMIYEGGDAHLKKINGIWKLINTRRTWIE